MHDLRNDFLTEVLSRSLVIPVNLNLFYIESSHPLQSCLRVAQLLHTAHVKTNVRTLLHFA